jgi:hypothetical protein
MGICCQRFLEHVLFLLAHLSSKELFNLINIILHVVSVFTLDTSYDEKVIEIEGGQPCNCPPVSLYRSCSFFINSSALL